MIRVDPVTLEAIDAGINVSIRELESVRRMNDQDKRCLSRLKGCRDQIDRAIADKLEEFRLYDVDAQKRFEIFDLEMKRDMLPRKEYPEW